jgi:hypothetical protein
MGGIDRPTVRAYSRAISPRFIQGLGLVMVFFAKRLRVIDIHKQGPGAKMRHDMIRNSTATDMALRFTEATKGLDA